MRYKEGFSAAFVEIEYDAARQELGEVA